MLGAVVHRGSVRPEWIDFNGHMNVAYYVLAFDLGIDALWIRFGITSEHIEKERSSTFAAASQVLYRQELLPDDPYVVTSQVLAFDEKRIHQFQRMYHAEKGYLAATAEWLSLHVDLRKRKVAPWPEKILQGIRQVATSQPDWGVPAEKGSVIGIRKPIWAQTGEDADTA